MRPIGRDPGAGKRRVQRGARSATIRASRANTSGDRHAVTCDAPARDPKIFLSTGTRNDNEGQVRQFKRILKNTGYRLLDKELPFGHDWQNWRPLPDDALRYFFAIEKPPAGE